MTLPDDLHELSVAEASRLIGQRRLSPVQLTRACLDRAERFDPQLNAFLLVTAGPAMAQAASAEAEVAAGHSRGPLHGIPFALKDVFDTAGIPTTGNSRVCAGRVPERDAAAVTRLYEAGGVLLGKLATHEFAHGGPSFDLPWPPARNPWNTGHFTGGSSSGSAAAVAAGLVPAALGSDTGGSIRLPAALCGIVGLKPTYGLVSREGIIPNSYTFDHAGPMAWTVADCAMLLTAIAGHPATDYAAALTDDLRGVRIGVVRHFHEMDIETDPEVVAAFDAAVDVLRGLGATIVDGVTLRPAKRYSDVKIAIAESELFSVHAEALRARPGDFGEDFLGRVLGAVMFGGGDYVNAQRERRRMLDEAAPVWRRCDALVTPTAPAPAPAFGQWRTTNFWAKATFTAPFNVLGGPALSQCMGFSRAGLPLGLQVAGAPFADAAVLQVAHAYERATPWRARRPALVPGAQPPELPGPPTPSSGLGAAGRAAVSQACSRAGLTLTERQFDLACVAAPFAEAIADRLRQPRAFGDEPASTFHFGAS